MSRFRLELARRAGEATTRDFGFSEFPIDPFEVAEQEDIHVEPKPPDVEGVSGGIIFHDESVGIFYATNIKSEGFRRFTVGHELGHFYLPGHPEEILKSGPLHVSRAGFTQGSVPIEIEADHFSAGLLMPRKLVRRTLRGYSIGLAGIRGLAEDAICSTTASAIRAAECADYPMAVIVSRGDSICYGFLSEGFKRLGRLTMLRKGEPLPPSITREFNAGPSNVARREEVCGETTLSSWFGGPTGVALDEEVLGLGEYGYTLTVLTSEALPDDPDEHQDEEAALIESYTPRFSYRR